jgi:AsmA protein
MIRRVWVILAELLVASVIVFTAGLFWVAHYVDSEEFRLRFVSLVEDAVGRPVTLGGELDIVLYPMPSLEVTGLSVADDARFGSEPLAEIDTVNVSVRALPLMSGRVEIPSILVKGLRASVVRSAEGAINWMTLLGERKPPRAGTGDSFQIDSVEFDEMEILGASIAYRDDMDGVRLSVSGIDLRTGGSQAGGRVPFVASSDISWDKGGVDSRLVLKGVVLVDEGWTGFSLDDVSVYASVGGSFLPRGASPGELAARLVFDRDKRTVALEDLHARFLGLSAEGSLQSGDLDQALSAGGSLTLRPFVPADIITRYSPKAPVSAVDGLRRAAFTTALKVDEKSLSLDDMTLTLDDTTLRGRLTVENFSAPVLEFALHGDILDLDRYLPLIMTDAPFVWGDYHLDAFRNFRGKGTVAMDRFTLSATRYADVRLAVESVEEAITAAASAMDADGVKLDATARFALGRDAATGHPTLALRGSMEARSGPSGFAAFTTTPLRLTGPSTFTARAETGALVCPPEARSIDILRAVIGQATLRMGKGTVGVKNAGRLLEARDIASGEATISVKPRQGGAGDNFEFAVSAGVEARGARPGETFAATAAGPLSVGVDTPYAASRGLSVSGQVAGPLYFGRDGAVSLAGVLAFDTRAHTLALSRGVLTALGTDIRGDIRVTDLDTRFRAAGNVAVARANPSGIIRQLSGKTIATKDPDALTAASYSSRFTLDGQGFTLDDVTAELDGMEVRGNVVGTGLDDPMLSFAFTAGALDIDRYLPPSLTEEERRSGAVSKAPPVDMPLGFLRALRLNGKGRFEEFKLGKVRARPFSGLVSADKGIIRVHDARGTVHEGTLEGTLSGQVGKESLATQLQLDIRQMQAAPLMVDMAGRDYVRGTADVAIDLQSTGRTDDDIVANLKGAARLQVRNGSFKFTGYDIKPVATTRDRNGGQSADDPRTRRTVFRKATSEFAVERGVFSVTSFRVEAPPVLQCYGSGNFSLPDDTINLAIRNDFVAVPSVTIELVGKLSDPQVRVPKERILNDTVRNILSLPEKSFNFLRDLFK